MRALPRAVLAALFTAILVAPMVTVACPVEGTVICQRTSPTAPVVPLANVGLTFSADKYTYPNSWSALPELTDASGWFTFNVGCDGYCPEYWNVTLDLSRLGGSAALAMPQVFIGYALPSYVLAPIEVSAADLPLCGGSQSACDLTAVPDGAIACGDRPWGNPRAECSHFGDFVPVGDGYTVDGGQIRATMVADFAIVKAARACYAMTKNVTIGEVLTLPLQGGVSHVTYCGCPAK